MSISIGYVTVPIFARFNDKDFEIGKLKVEVTAVPVDEVPA